MPLSDLQSTQADQASDDRARTIRDRLRDAIVDRRLSPGAKLSEADVGGLFDVSRTVVRAALLMLAFEGLVRIERNRGAFVADPSPDEAQQVFAARRLIEPGLAAAACARISSADIAAFRTQLAEELRLDAERGPAARRAEIRASGEFHRLLAAVAGNVILERFMEELIARSSLVIALYGRSVVSSCAHDDHAQIVDALEQRDARAAGALLVRHIDQVEADLDLRTRGVKTLRQALNI